MYGYLGVPFRLGALTPEYPYGAAARFTLTGIQPPAASYLAPSDQLSLSVLSPNAPISFNLSLRFLDLKGEVQPLLFEVQAPATGATPFVLPIQSAEGFLLSATAFGATVQRGQCWIQFMILRQKAADITVVGDVILQGYVSQTDIVSYPGTQERSSIEGRGWMNEIIVPAPPVGASITVTVPPGTRWKPISVFVGFSDSANFNNPTVRYLDASGNTVQDSVAFISTQTSVSFGTWALGQIGFLAGLVGMQGIGQDTILKAGWQIVITIEPPPSATIQFTQAKIVVEEWAELG